MKRLLRWFWNGLTILSLLLCVATAVLWVRSYFRTDTVMRFDEKLADHTHHIHRDWEVLSSRGELGVWTSKFLIEGSWAEESYKLGTSEDGRPSGWRFYTDRDVRYDELKAQLTTTFPFGCRAKHFRWQMITGEERHGTENAPWLTSDERLAFAPYWAVTMLAGTAPAIRLTLVLKRRGQARRRKKRRLCPVCGYDLRASPDRCPECGTATQAKAAL